MSGLAAGALVSLALSAVLIMFARPILLLLQVPVAILTEAALYVRIIMVGLFFHFCYGYFSTVLRAMGDSQTTLFILAVSAGLNVLGDYLLLLFWLGHRRCCRKHGPLRIALILVLFAFSCKFYG